MRASSRSPSFSSSRSRPLVVTESTTAAVITPMMVITTRISMSVKPRVRSQRIPTRGARLVADVPVADVGIDTLAARLAIGAEAVEVIFLAVLAGVDVEIVIAPGVLVQVLDVAARLPVLDRGIGRLRDERRQALLAGRVLGVVEPVHGERGLDALDVLLRLRDARVVDA